jgi:hypothetical protein
MRILVLLVDEVAVVVEVVHLLMTGCLVVHVDELLKHKNIPNYGIVQVVVLLS